MILDSQTGQWSPLSNEGILSREMYSLFIFDLPPMTGRERAQVVGDKINRLYPGDPEDVQPLILYRKGRTRHRVYLHLIPKPLWKELERKKLYTPASFISSRSSTDKEVSPMILNYPQGVEYLEGDSFGVVKSLYFPQGEVPQEFSHDGVVQGEVTQLVLPREKKYRLGEGRPSFPVIPPLFRVGFLGVAALGVLLWGDWNRIRYIQELNSRRQKQIQSLLPFYEQELSGHQERERQRREIQSISQEAVVPGYPLFSQLTRLLPPPGECRILKVEVEGPRFSLTLQTSDALEVLQRITENSHFDQVHSGPIRPGEEGEIIQISGLGRL